MENFINHPWVNTLIFFIRSHPILWFVLLFLFIFIWFLNLLANVIPQFSILKSKILLPIAERYKYKKLIKSAIRSDIKGHVNRELSKMRDYLPQGWVQDIDIDWVKSEDTEILKKDNKIVIRVRPLENQDHNFVNTTYHYLKSSFFPKMQAVIPKPHFEASVLYICNKIVSNRSKSTREIFEELTMEPMCQKHSKIPIHLEEYKDLDNRGFFTGTFLRELHLMAISARFNSNRNNMTQETSIVIKHIKDFIEKYDAFSRGEDRADDSAWYYSGPISNYAILLVANPGKTKNGIDTYINKAKERFNSGTHRLYVFGGHDERKFAEAVFAGILGTIDNVKLIEKYNTHFDYRGDPDGIGAIFEIDSNI